MFKRKKKLVIFLWFPVLIFALTLLKFLQRGHLNWQENIKLQDSSIITLNFDYSNFRGYGDPNFEKGHSVIGLNSPLYKLEFSFKGKIYEKRSKYKTILLNLYGNEFYSIEFGKDKESGRDSLRYLKFEKGWKEISPKEFPKQIAVANLGLEKDAGKVFLKESGYKIGIPINEFEMTKKLDTDFAPFQSSLTAKIWLEIAKGIKYFEAPYDVDNEFLKDFKEKYFLKNKDNQEFRFPILMPEEKNEIKDDSNKLNGKSANLSTMFFLQLVLLFAIIGVFYYFGGRIVKKTEKEDEKKFKKIILNFSAISIVITFFYLKFFNDLVLFIIWLLYAPKT